MKRVLGPSGSFWLRERFEGRIPALLGRSVLAASLLPSGHVRLELASTESGTEVLDVDHVLAGTGYRIDVDALRFLDGGIRAQLRRIGQAPMLDATSESSVRGLYFTGLAAAPTFGPYLRFVAGTRFAGPRIARAIAAAGRRVPMSVGWASGAKP